MDLTKNEIIQWGLEYLSSHGYTLKSNHPENVQIRPWSYVIRYDTSAGWIYLKQTPKLIALEAAITKILHDQFNAPVLEVIASNFELDCFLMKDAGNPLRAILKKQFDAKLLCKAVGAFTAMQIEVSNDVDAFLNIGVLDYRLNKLPDLYKALISKKDILLADGLLEKEIGELESLTTTVSELCKKLSEYAISQTLVQPDFHDNNTLIDDALQKITIIDLGEIVISHPFFSLINFLAQIKKHHGLTEQDSAYQNIQDACFKNFTQFESLENLLNAFELARILLPIYGVLAGYRLIEACDKKELIEYYGTGMLRNQLKEFAIHAIVLCGKITEILENKC